ncbi:hypothetical protein KC337_g45 [Hortaea werneckii]|nr:hypothetical protein KC337_g45 [Hortaea werneckii]
MSTASMEYFGTDNGKLIQENVSYGIAKANINDIVNAPYMDYLQQNAEGDGEMYGLVQVIWTGRQCEDGVSSIKVSTAIAVGT